MFLAAVPIIDVVDEEFKTSKFLYCVDHLQLNHPEQLHTSPKVAFDPGKFGLYNWVHVSEKWFHVQEVFKQGFYLTKGKRGSIKRTKHKGGHSGLP